MFLEIRNKRTQLYKGRFEDGVFLLVGAVLEINYEALQV